MVKKNEVASNGHTVQRFRTDRGREFVNEDVITFINDIGIREEYSMPYNQAQNGVVERRHRFIAGLARSMLRDSGLPHTLWAEAYLNAATTINKIMPSRIEPRKSREEMWTGIRSNVHNFLPFGTPGVAHIEGTVPKLNDRGVKGFLVGYDTHQYPGYRFYVPSTRRVAIVRNIQFDLFPLSSTNLPLHADPHEESIPNISTTDSNIEMQLENEDLRQSKSNTNNTRKRKNTVVSEYELRSRRPDNTPHTIVDDEDVLVENHLLSTHHAILTTVQKESPLYTPRNLSDALSCPESYLWRESIINELKSLQKRNTFQFIKKTSIQANNLVDSKWIFVIKIKNDGSLKYKSRLVARGFSQIEGVDYDDTYSPVCRMSTTYTIFSIACAKGWAVHQMDVDTAYLYADLDHDIYMKIPDGLNINDALLPDFVCHDDEYVALKKALYGLKQSGLQWYKNIKGFIESLGYKASKSDQCLFTIWNPATKERNIILIYVDDILTTGDNLNEITRVKQAFNKNYDMKDLGLCSKFLGITVKQSIDHSVIEMSAKTYIEKLINELDMVDDKIYPPKYIPMDPNLKLTDAMSPTTDTEKEIMKNIPYRRVIGILNYIANILRYDILVPLSHCSRYNNNPGLQHWQAVQQIICYLKSSINIGIRISGSGTNLSSYSDSSFGDCLDTRRSRGGGVVLLGTNIIKAFSKRLPTVSLSTMDAESATMTDVTKEVIYFRGLLEELGYIQKSPTILFADNMASIHISQNPIGNKSKHLEIKMFFIREKIANGEICLHYIPSANQLADLFTKNLARPQFEKIRTELGLVTVDI